MIHHINHNRLPRSRALSRTAALLACSAVVSACAGIPRTSDTPAPAALRVMTYNIFGGKDLDRRSNLTRVAALIDSLRADFVLLQEVDRVTARSGHVDQANELAERTGMRAVFARAMDFDGGEYGIAILSRWPVLSWRVVPLAATLPAELTASAPEPRALLHVRADAPGGLVHVLNTHLDHGAHSVGRNAQLLQLLAYVAEAVPRGEIVVLGGDLNARPDTPEVRALGITFDDAWAACGAGDGHTFRSDEPTRRIDYVLLVGARCTHAEVIGARHSDHLPVVVDLVLRR